MYGGCCVGDWEALGKLYSILLLLRAVKYHNPTEVGLLDGSELVDLNYYIALLGYLSLPDENRGYGQLYCRPF